MSAVKGPDDGRSSVVVDWERLKRWEIHQLHPVVVIAKRRDSQQEV
jgi:hypothetical protein